MDEDINGHEPKKAEANYLEQLIEEAGNDFEQTIEDAQKELKRYIEDTENFFDISQ